MLLAAIASERQHVFNWIQMCEESEMGVLCVTRS